ncbi:MAG TPA: hypothetical protein VFI96_02165, partial [Longimicrobiaceae bacterium]|nr:hypothetical protein [Longimicrobiaceae bacterium]
MTPFRPLPVLLSLLLAAPAAAQVRDSAQTARPISAVLGQPRTGQGTVGTPNYDVVLEVPRLTVDSIGLDVANLQAHLALNANAMNLVVLNAGVDVGIDRVKLDLTGVGAEAYLYVDLDNVARIVDRVIATLNRNPQLVTRLL